MWDNRLTKSNPRAPDFKYRDRSCDGVVWPARSASGNTPANGRDGPADQGGSSRIQRRLGSGRWSRWWTTNCRSDPPPQRRRRRRVRRGYTKALAPSSQGLRAQHARSGTRTRTASRPANFKSAVSTGFTIRAADRRWRRSSGAQPTAGVARMQGTRRRVIRARPSRPSETALPTVLGATAQDVAETTKRERNLTAAFALPVAPERETGLEPATPTLARLCSTN